MSAIPIRPGDVYSIHFRYHPLLDFDVVAIMVKNETISFRMFHPFDGRKDTAVYKCSLADFRIYFIRNMERPKRMPTTADVGIMPAEFTEEELRFLASGMENKLF